VPRCPSKTKRAFPQAPRRCRNRRRIISGLRSTLDSCCLSRAIVSAVEPTTWRIYASFPQNPCSRSPLPRTGDLTLAQTIRKTAYAPWRPGNSVREQFRPMQTGIRESRFNATVGVQLLGHLSLSQLSDRLLCYREHACVFLTEPAWLRFIACSP